MVSAVNAHNHYYREYGYDLPVDPKKDSLVKRILCVALPYIALYRPVGFLLTLALDLLRVVTNVTQAGKSVWTIVVSVVALVSTIFAHPLGLIITTARDIQEACVGFFRELTAEKYEKAFEAGMALLTSALYLSLLICGGTELLIAALAMQLIKMVYASRKEYQQGNYLEAAGHFGIALIQGKQIATHLKALWRRNLWHDLLYYLRKPFDALMERSFVLRMKTASVEHVSEKTILQKVQFVASTVFFVLMAPISVTLWAIAGALDTLRHKFFPAPYTYLEGYGQEKLGDPKRVVSWNVCMLFGGLPTVYGGVAPTEERIQAVAQKIVAQNADVVCLQEVSPPAAQLLYEALKKEYKHFYTRIDSESIFMHDSALCVISKVPLTDFKVTSLPHLSPLHRACASFRAGSYNFLTTHLEPGEDSAARQMRQKQIEILLQQGIAPKTVLLGDLNMERVTEYPTTSLSRLFYDRLPPKITATDYFSAQNRDIPPVNYSIDYILTTPDVQGHVILVEGYNLAQNRAESDHHLLQSTLSY